MYIKTHGFGQNSILMRVELFEIFMSETSEIYLFFDILLVSDRKMVPNHITTMVPAVWLVDKKPLGIKTKRTAHFFPSCNHFNEFFPTFDPEFQNKEQRKESIATT
jgi:hypothetical protein